MCCGHVYTPSQLLVQRMTPCSECFVGKGQPCREWVPPLRSERSGRRVWSLRRPRKANHLARVEAARQIRRIRRSRDKSGAA